MKKFTDGKWRLVLYKNIIVWVGDTDLGNSEIEANARLIAAAPDMYEFIKVISTWFDDDECGDEFRPDVLFEQMVSTAKELLARIDGGHDE